MSQHLQFKDLVVLLHGPDLWQPGVEPLALLVGLAPGQASLQEEAAGLAPVRLVVGGRGTFTRHLGYNKV